MKRRQFLIFTAALLIVSPIWALQPPATDGSDAAVPGKRLSREEAARRAQKKLGGGRVLGVRLRDGNSRVPYFDVKVLDGGKIKVLRINAQ